MNDVHPVVRVVLVDDHPVVRAGLRALIDGLDDVIVVGEAYDLASAERAAVLDRPDVVLMDLNLGDGPGGAEVTARLRALPDAPQVLILTTYDTESDILRALEAGAKGYLLKDAPADELFAAIRATARGETVLASSVAALLVRRASAPGPVVTDREVEVLELLARGLGNKEMAQELFVSEATVKSHLSHVYAKLGVDTRAGAVAAAIEKRIIRR
jgi:DNA-binding NarL/FixJ family response regulator